VIFLHQGRQIIGGQIIYGQPNDEDDETDGEDMNSQEFPDETIGQAETLLSVKLVLPRIDTRRP
jgi:hypothetical protein